MVQLAAKHNDVVKNLRLALAACGTETKMQEVRSLINRAISATGEVSAKATRTMTQKLVADSQSNGKKWWDAIKEGLDIKPIEAEENPSD